MSDLIQWTKQSPRRTACELYRTFDNTVSQGEIGIETGEGQTASTVLAI
jgi:hypothetical protein